MNKNYRIILILLLLISLLFTSCANATDNKSQVNSNDNKKGEEK